MYCVEINTAIDRDHGMVEQPWAEVPERILAVPREPRQDQLGAAPRLPGRQDEALAKLLTEQGADADRRHRRRGSHRGDAGRGLALQRQHRAERGGPAAERRPREAEADVVALYKYLTGDANVGIGDQPTPALASPRPRSPARLASKIGPFTVTTTGDIEKLTSKLPEGVKITDANGTELTAEDDQERHGAVHQRPEGRQGGRGHVRADRVGQRRPGRLFVGENYAENPTQSLIVAMAEKSRDRSRPPAASGPRRPR